MITVRNLYKTYGLDTVSIEALKNINMEIKSGDFIAIKGPSGCGKSTLLNIIGCLEKPTSGEVLLDGINVGESNNDELANIRRDKIGFIFQNYNLIPTMNSLENVALPMMFAGKDEKEIYNKATQLLQSAKMGERINHKPSELSGGEQQRVSIARALINNPSIIIADEPTGNLDSKTGKIIMDMLINLNKEGKTIILVTHDLTIAKMANKIIYIKDGEFVEGEI
ncbi:MAG: ABC transporter ATP-binding protein [Clostridia bacterium]|nr:ABC transporter ATP-binding protein [Clostridia bacterium]